MERCDASIFAGGGDVRSGECRPGGRYAGPAVSPRQLHRGPDQRQGQLAGLLCRRPGELRLGHFEGGARRQQRPAIDASFRRPTSATIGNRWQTPTATPPALAALSDTIRSGTTSSSVSRRITSMTESARFRIRWGCAIRPTRHAPKPDPFERDRETLGFRLAAHPRRLRHGMLPAISVCRHRLRQPDRRSHRFGLSGPGACRPTTAASKTKLVYGYSAGAGVDVMLVGGLFVRAEYEYRRVTSDIESNINTVRAGLGYKF